MKFHDCFEIMFASVMSADKVEENHRAIDHINQRIGFRTEIPPPSTDTLAARKTSVVECGTVELSARLSAVLRTDIQAEVMKSREAQGLIELIRRPITNKRIHAGKCSLGCFAQL